MAQHDSPYRRPGGEQDPQERRHRNEFEEDEGEMSPMGGQGGQFSRHGQQFGQGGRSGGRFEGQQGGGYGNGPGYGGREELDQGRFQQRGRYGPSMQRGGMREDNGWQQRDPYTGYGNGMGSQGPGNPDWSEGGRLDWNEARRQQQFDPDYHQWRNEQMKSLDDDYENWRQERYKKFSDEFSTWRSARQKSGANAPGGGVGGADTSRGSAHITEPPGSAGTPADTSKK